MKKGKIFVFLLSIYISFFSSMIIAKADGLYKLEIDPKNGDTKSNVYVRYSSEDVNIYENYISEKNSYANITNIGTNVPIRKGYAFYGYYLENNSNPFILKDGSFNTDSMYEYLTENKNLSKTIKISARWERLDFQIDLVANKKIFRKVYFSNQSDDLLYSQTSVLINSIDIPLCSNPNYEFSGYYFDNIKVIDEHGNFIFKTSKSGKRYAAIKKAIISKKHATLSAKWRKKTVKNQNSNTSNTTTEESNTESSNNTTTTDTNTENNNETTPAETNESSNGGYTVDNSDEDKSTDTANQSQITPNYVEDDSEYIYNVETNKNNTSSESTKEDTESNNTKEDTSTSNNNSSTDDNSNNTVTNNSNDNNNNTTTSESEDFYKEYEEDLDMEYEGEDGELESNQLNPDEDDTELPYEEEEGLSSADVEDLDSDDYDSQDSDSQDSNEYEETDKKYALCYLKNNNVGVGGTKVFKYDLGPGYEGYNVSVELVKADQKVVEFNEKTLTFKGLKTGTIKVRLVGTKNGAKKNIRTCSILVHHSPVTNTEQTAIQADTTNNNLLKSAGSISMSDLKTKNSAPKKIVCKTNEIKVDSTEKLKYSVSPSTANQNVTLTSKNPKIVSIKSGKIKGIKAGTAKIEVVSKKDKTVKKTCTVKVVAKNIKKSNSKKASKTSSPSTKKQKQEIKSLTAKNLTVKKGNQKKIEYSIDPSTALKSKEFISSNKSVATVGSAGKVTGKSKGTADITIKVIDKEGKTKKTKIKVTVKK